MNQISIKFNNLKEQNFNKSIQKTKMPSMYLSDSLFQRALCVDSNKDIYIWVCTGCLPLNGSDFNKANMDLVAISLQI